MITKDLHPPHIVGETGFRSFVKALNPSCDIALSAYWVRAELLKKYDDTKAKMMLVLRSNNCMVLTAEMWSKSSDNYLTVSCHFIDDKWKRQSYVLETSCLKETSPSAIVEEVARIGKLWEIEKKIIVVVSNVGDMNKPCLQKKWGELPCFASVLETVTKKVISDHWEKLVNKCNNIALQFNNDHRVLQKFRDNQARLNLPQCSLFIARDKKWLSIVQLLERVLEQRQPINKTLIELNQLDDIVGDDEEMKIKSVLGVLSPFKEAVKQMGSGYHCISETISILVEIHAKLTENRSEEAAKIARQCEGQMRQMKQNRWLIGSMVLDPRFKATHCQDQIESTKSELLRKLNDITSTQNGPNLKDDLNKYLRDEKRPRTGNPLPFWRFEQPFQVLAPLARTYLTVVSTALPVERAFQPEYSRLDNIRRNCLEAEHVNLMLFLQANLAVD